MPAPLALCSGSFDPITHGHVDVVRRTLAFADRVLVAVGHRASQSKRGMFTVDERLEMIREVFHDEPRVEPAEFSGLLVRFARERGVTLVVRGLRSGADFEYELPMSRMNHDLMPDLETVFLAADPRLQHISSSLVREIASLGGDVSAFVPEPVLRRIRERAGGGQ